MSLSAILVPIVISSIAGVSLDSAEEILHGNYYKVKTSMKDETLLKKALENRGSDVQLEKMQIEASIGAVDIVFQREEDDTISAFLNKNVEREEAIEFLQNVETEYRRLVQQQTYEKLLQRAKHEGLILNSNTVNEDNSIVLTFNVEE